MDLLFLKDDGKLCYVVEPVFFFSIFFFPFFAFPSRPPVFSQKISPHYLVTTGSERFPPSSPQSVGGRTFSSRSLKSFFFIVSEVPRPPSQPRRDPGSKKGFYLENVFNRARFRFPRFFCLRFSLHKVSSALKVGSPPS